MTRNRRLGGVLMLGMGAALGGVAATELPQVLQVQARGPVAVTPADTSVALPPPTSAQVQDARQLSNTFARVAAQVGPSVVRISVAKTVDTAGANPFHGTPLERFFGQGPGEDAPRQQGTGSGVVIDERGHILTNNHVVEDADEVKVTFQDGKVVPGKVVGTDPKSDLAVVKVEGVAVKAAKLGDSENMLVGEWVMAIGNPFGLDHTVTVGVLSAKNRSVLGGGRYEDFLQTDASINPGNSGGPLINLDGEVIGINSMIAGIGTGIGFAVPSSMAKPIAEQLIRDGRVRRPYLGILMQDVTPEIHKSLGASSPEKGALVSEVQAGSPAEKSGVRPGDILTAVDGQDVEDSKGVQKVVLSRKIGQALPVTLWREGKTQKLSITTGELPGDKDVASKKGRDEGGRAKLGLSLQTLSPELAERLGMDPKAKGVLVAHVAGGSPADKAGVREGDILLDVNGKRVNTAEEAVRALTAPRADGHLLRIKRGDGALFLALPSP